MINYVSEGAGPPVVLLHGVGLDHSMWARCLPALAQNCHVTAVDLRGHGASPAAAAGVTLGDLASDVVEILDRITAGSAHLVGFSLGALVAQELALTEPTRVRSLTLVSSVAGRDAEQRAAVRDRLDSARADYPATVEAALHRWFAPHLRATDPDLVEQVRKTMLSTDQESYLSCYRIFATADASLWPRLPAIGCPTLAVTGADDPGSTPEMTIRLADAIPGAQHLVLPRTRHLLPLEHPDELASAVLHLIERTDHDRH